MSEPPHHTAWHRLCPPLLLYVTSLGLTLYCLLSACEMAHTQGVAYLRTAILTGEKPSLLLLKYQPAVVGVLLALIQFGRSGFKKAVQETGQVRQIATALSRGGGALLLLFGIQMGLNQLLLTHFLPQVQTEPIHVTTLPWFMAGVAGYGLTALIRLESSTPRRIIDLLFATAIIHLYYVATAPGAYAKLLPIVALFSLAMLYMPLVTVDRRQTRRSVAQKSLVARLFGILYALLFITLLCWALPLLLRLVPEDTAGSPTHLYTPSATATDTVPHSPHPLDPYNEPVPQATRREKIRKALIPFELTFTSDHDHLFRPRISDVSPLPLILWHLIGFGLLYRKRRKHRTTQHSQ